MARARRRPGIKGRLDAVQGHAHATMNTAQGAIEAVKAAALGFLDNLQDGIEIKLTRDPKVSLMDFVTGKATELPFGLQVTFPDDDEDDE